MNEHTGYFWLGFIVGFFVAVAGIAFSIEAHASTVTPIFGGGTGTSTLPSYGKLLVGDANGNYELLATSSLGISGGGSSFGYPFPGNATTTPLSISYASTTALTISGTAYIGSLSGILKATAGTVSAATNGTDYTLITAKTCTNQVITAVTAAGVFTCASVGNAALSYDTISGIALGNNLDSLSNDGATLSGSSYNGSATVSNWAINLSHANTWAALQQFANATSTLLTFTTGWGTAATITNASTTAITASNYLGINGTVTASETLPATTTAITLNWATTGPQIDYQIGGSATTITLINATTSLQAGSRKVVWICNPGSTAGALTWTGVEWIGTAPAQTTTANECDIYSFDVTKATSTSAWKVAGTQGAGFQ